MRFIKNQKGFLFEGRKGNYQITDDGETLTVEYQPKVTPTSPFNAVSMRKESNCLMIAIFDILTHEKMVGGI